MSNERFKLHLGKSEDVLKQYPDSYFDSCVCDPPYALTSIVKRFGGKNAAPAKHGTDGAFSRASRGFMGMTWDTGDTAFKPEFWAEVFRVLKPGGHLLAFSGSRTYHRMAVGIEDAGFEIRDSIHWTYVQGMPKSHDVSKNIDKMQGNKRRVVGKKTIKKLQYRPGQIEREMRVNSYDITLPGGADSEIWSGWGTSMKPSHEPICLARKPLSETSIARNVLTHGTGALNIDGCRVEGNRWPANTVATGLDEEFSPYFFCSKASQKDRNDGLEGSAYALEKNTPKEIEEQIKRLLNL